MRNKNIKKTNQQGNTSLPKLDKKAIAAFLKANPSLDLKKANTFNQKQLKTLNWGKYDQTVLLPQLKALQRLVRLTHDLSLAEALYENGLHAAVQIATIPQHKFVEQYASLFKPHELSSEEQAKQVHQQALARKSQAVLTYTAIAQHHSPHYRATRFNNLSAGTDATYSNLPSYQDLFGELEFCSCPECRTIFSPAAYFVDLMRLQDYYISKDTKATPPAQLLQDRRPDLWDLVLDCKNTNTLVSKLQIVNQVLLRSWGEDASYENLATKNYPFNLPFHLPLARIHLYLSQSNQSLDRIWQALDVSPERITLPIARESLQLSPAQWLLYSTPQTDPAQLAALYGLQTGQEPVSTLTAIDVFLTQTGLSYVQLQELVYEDLSSDEIVGGLNRFFFINSNVSGAAAGPIEIDTDKNLLTNLTLERLDHIHRFIRLAQALKWSFTDLDWTLRTIGAIINTKNSSLPVIEDDALPYLAWIHPLHQQYKLTINASCALIGSVKDFGSKHGPAFFDQIFNNSYVPNPPAWKDAEGNYSLIWNVPQPSSQISIENQDIQIQNALAAALQISQEDLLRIANLLLQALHIDNNKLPLTLDNLSILYRLSQLPILTGLRIEECYVALSLPGVQEDALLNLAGSGAEARRSLVELQNFAGWLKKTPFSVYQLQFILTGNSQDPTIQNQILGIDKITNFLNELHTVIQPILLTEQQFTTVLNPTLENIFGNQTGDLGIRIYSKLQDISVDYINPSGVITAQGAAATVDQLQIILQDIIPTLPVDTLYMILDLIVSTLQNSYQLQETTLTQQLASLYNVSPTLAYALELWSGLTLVDLENTEIVKLRKSNFYVDKPLRQPLLANPVEGERQTCVLLGKMGDIVKRLQLLQQYAVLLQSLALSSAEVQAMVDNPGYFGMITTGTGADLPLYRFTLANIQTLVQFKQLIQSFQDTENHLLDYFGIASITSDLEKVANQLAQVTKWDAAQIQFLLELLWPIDKKKGKALSFQDATPKYATVAGVEKLKAYFDIARQLNIDIPTLWELAHATSNSIEYSIYQRLADALWAGLQKRFQDQPSQLAVLQNMLDEIQRTALLDLVIYQLRTQKNLPITTARDLYEYLLIDVEVSGEVQTSYVKEAVSTVQLYLYRCFNSLEEGTEVHTELYTWWPWLENYRVWEANRKVFLYPENYIQPELRKDKTPQFTQLEEDLQQSNLTTDAVQTAVKTYIDGFAEVATLEIVGSYVYAGDISKSNEQILYLVGRTSTQTYNYYYRKATLVPDPTGQTYLVAQWTPWIKIDLQINSTVVSPVYAFNRLFLFWAETTPSTSGKDTNEKTFEATLYYSFYDFNKHWSAPQQLMDAVPLPVSVNTQEASEALVWHRIRAVFAADREQSLLYWTWGDKESDHFYAGTINKQLRIEPGHAQLKDFRISNAPSVVVYQGKLYTFYKDDTGPAYCVLENGKWQLQRLSGVGLTDKFNCVEYQGQLYCFHQGNTNNGELWYFILQDGSMQIDNLISKGMLGSPSFVVFSSLWHGLYKSIYVDFLEHITAYKEAWRDEGKVPNVSMSGSPSSILLGDYVHCFYQGPNSDGKLWYFKAAADGEIWNPTPKQIPLSSPILGNPSAVFFQNKLYCFYQSKDKPGTLWYAALQDDGTWKNAQVTGANIGSDPSVVVYQGNLYCFYQGRGADGNGDGQIWYSTLWPLSDRALTYLGLVQGLQINLPSNVIPGNEFTWSIDKGPDGTQFLSIPIPSSINKQEIRLNSMVVYDLSQILFSQGIDVFLSFNTQKTPEINIDGSKTTTLDFSGANGLYYWELFFHMPLLVAHTLNTQQQFEVAKKWYEYIFNPTVSKNDWDLVNNEDPRDKYWRFLGLRSQYNPILQQELDETWAEEVQIDLQNSVQLAAYHDDPFDPHAIARLRPIAYQKTLVMHYIDNLLTWADNLFRQYTIETIVEATMLYVMAYDLLGEQPVSLGPCPLPDPETLQQIASHYNNSLKDIPEFLIQVEQAQQGSVLAMNAQDTPHNYIPGDYFGLPENSQFIAYWDQVKQRLYNIRHNLNIDGVYQRLPLFEPAINPMQLVAAVASADGIGSALVGTRVDVPYYRFNEMIGKAQALTQTVIQLGQSLLSVLERQDAEQLTLLYSTNQQNLLALTRTSKQDQLLSATQTVAALQASLQNAQDRFDHYTHLLNQGLSTGEQAQIALESAAIYYQVGAQFIKGVSIAGYLIPTIYGTSVGGSEPGNAIAQGAYIAEGTAQAINMSAGLAGTISSYQRRAEDWQLQQTLAQDDIAQMQSQIVAAQYQEHVASEEIDLLEKQIEQEQAVQAFLKNKFTRAQLYKWMVGKIAALYFQAYQLAYNVAMQAEKAWQFERCDQQSFIHPTYWDNLYQGLVAGESLQLDLQRMEKAYMDKNERRLEIEKIISLAQLDPQALEDLKATGTCNFDLTERDFDYDYRGHYARQVKRISLSFPALLGPYQNMHATLTQTANKTLLKADVEGVKYLLGKDVPQPDSSVLRVDIRANQQVALSEGTGDDGLFVVNFDDPRYLPFEGTGAISSWRLDMPKDCNGINFDSMTDVIIDLQYTALAGNNAFQAAVKQNLGNFNGYQPLIMTQYANSWYSFIQQGQPLLFAVSPALLRPNLKNYQVTGITITLLLTASGEKVTSMPTLNLKPGLGTEQSFPLHKDVTTGIVAASVTGLTLDISNMAEWQVTIGTDPGDLLTPANVNNMIIVLEYTANFN